MTLLTRRFVLSGLIAAPAVVAASHIMPVRSIERFLVSERWQGTIGDYAWRSVKWKDTYLNISDHNGFEIHTDMEVKHCTEIDPREWRRLTDYSSDYDFETRSCGTFGGTYRDRDRQVRSKRIV